MKTNPDEPVNGINHLIREENDYIIKSDGLTKREYFAGLAMTQRYQGNENAIAEFCVAMADALIKELNKDQEALVRGDS